MFNLALSVQVIATIVCLAAVLVVAFQKTSSYSNIIVIAFVCTFVQNGGYILELISKNANEGMMAVKGEYLGGAFEISLITFFMFKYCGHEFKSYIQVLFILESVFVLFGVWTWEFTHMYYTGVDFVSDSTIPHLVMSHGWLYFTFAGFTVLELIGCIFILAVSILKTDQKHMKFNYFILLLVVIFPFFGFVISILGFFDGYDATPVSAAIAVGIFAFAIARKHVFDVADAASELILANLDNAIVIINNEDGYEYSNKQAEKLFPALKTYSRGDVIKDIDVKNLFDEKRYNQITIGDRQFEVSINKVKYEEEEIGTTVILFDVTESKLQIEKMKKLMFDAEEASRAKSAFLANVSHEIRTPINVVMGMSEVLLRDYSTEETKEYLYSIRNSSNTLLNLISDILDFSKIDSGKLEITNTRFDVSKMLSEIVNIYNFRCSQKSLDFEYNIAPDIPRYLIGDEIRIRQVITNLLSNAVKYTEKGSVKLRFGYKFRSDYDLDLIMAVEDTGVGIKREDFDKLFMGFGRDNMKRNNTIEGTGLGLNITKQLVEMMGGIINFKSEEGKGSVFSVIIPLIAVSDSIETVGKIVGEQVEENVFHTPFIAPYADILVVDDSAINLKVMKELLKEMKPSVTVVSSGEECLDIVRQKHFDLIFMDHRMPGMDGVETFSRIKQSDNECQGVPVIMVTANATIDSKDWYIAKGFSDFLSKPVTSEQLAEMLYKYLPEELLEIKRNK